MRRTILAATWLLFLPNAPRLVTDLVHMPARADARYWIDLTLLGGAAGTGLLLGTPSNHLVHDALRRRHGDAVGWAVVGRGRSSRRDRVRPGAPRAVEQLGRGARAADRRGDVLMWAWAPLAHADAMVAAARLAGLVGAACLAMHPLLDPRSRVPRPTAGDRGSGPLPTGATS